MTIRDLYAYAQELGVEDHEIEIQYCDAKLEYYR